MDGKKPYMEDEVFLDAGLFIGALLRSDPRHAEARDVVNKARSGQISTVTTAGILCEVYAALTWEKSQPRHAPAVASEAVLAIVQSPSQIRLLPETFGILLGMLDLAKKHNLKARRIHDARHAATALFHGVCYVMTYDVGDWRVFETDGLKIIGPDSIVADSD